MNRRKLFLTTFHVGLLCTILFFSSAFAQGDPVSLQKQAIQRIDAFSDHVRKTGDFDSRMPDLAQADAELTESNRMFEARENWSALALGLIKRGDIYRWQSQWPNAIDLYRQAEKMAKRGNDIALQAKALFLRAKAERNSRNLGQALTDATEAVRLAKTTGDKDLLEQALDELGNIQLKQGNLDGALYNFNLEIEAAQGAKNPIAVFYAYDNRSNVYYAFAARCTVNEPSYERFYQALDLAKADKQKGNMGKYGDTSRIYV
ncbi:hypothetical protein SAMN04489760_1126 [Syntrophus gentianae]|uniref:Tetratricopeptide repeat-containing protein n=1 Tax=Syntrophus gentianae TaxID=43775 RepID=A0A1H7XS27_9BACT|nr:hypothetical protein [Syntrophus gentianae]SEM36676.1 hypothetical protein SAMN04489760_1126 [Syntrophus gentianae]